jgi:hypothetical protein
VRLKPKRRAQQTAARAGARGKGGKKAKRTSSSIGVTAKERWRMIAVAAYHKAEQRGFAPDGSMDDGLEAEKEIDVLLGVAQT